MELNTSPATRGASLQITTCAEDPAGPSPMIVTDLGSLGFPVAYTAEGVALAGPAEAAAEGGAGTIFAAPEAHSCGGRGVMGRGGRRQSHDGLSELLGAGYGVARRCPFAPRRRAGFACRAYLLCPGQLHHARPSATARGVGAPCSSRDSDGGWRNGWAVLGPPARAKRPAVARPRQPPTQAQNIAETRQLLGERFDEIGRRMTALERFIPASAAGGSAAGDTATLGDPLGALRNAGPSQVGETPGVLGVAAGPIDSAAALRDARAMLGRGTRESGGPPGRGTDELTLSAPAGLVGGPPPGVRSLRLEQQPQHGQQLPTATAFSEICWGGSSIYW